jgi:mono/diheme cytochrome c family protein
MKTHKLMCVSLLQFILISFSASAADYPADRQVVERGRYLVGVGACHDCHTPGFNEAVGKVSQSQWLIGSTVGFQGPWGTSYPVNLRLYVQNLTEAQWLARVRQPMRPPMPWFNLRDMKDDDLVAMYRFMRSLEPIGEPAPAAAAPGQKVTTPYFDFVPKNLPQHASR